MRTKKPYYIGLDVHKDSIWMAVLTDEQEEPIESREIANNYLKVVKAIAAIPGQGESSGGL
ncbi:hypothetical protein [Leadbettera azotonutricia]|uniref:hypothetical protein n=1 Tax=Leadbettera azotonutricia TaxID=150829 RepID=UPI0005C578E5|nr:hypothetical protein [Leadbettera azotonutricia]